MSVAHLPSQARIAVRAPNLNAKRFWLVAGLAVLAGVAFDWLCSDTPDATREHAFARPAYGPTETPPVKFAYAQIGPAKSVSEEDALGQAQALCMLGPSKRFTPGTKARFAGPGAYAVIFKQALREPSLDWERAGLQSGEVFGPRSYEVVVPNAAAFAVLKSSDVESLCPMFDPRPDETPLILR